MPALELDDGTMLTQSMPILDYVCKTYKLQPEDPYTNWLGASFTAYGFDDFFMKHIRPIIVAPDDQKAALIEKAFAGGEFTKYLTTFDARLKKQGTKFLCGDSICEYDFVIGGFFPNVVLNPNSKLAEHFAKYYADAPASVKAYAADFQAEMKEYLDGRP